MGGGGHQDLEADKTKGRHDLKEMGSGLARKDASRQMVSVLDDYDVILFVLSHILPNPKLLARLFFSSFFFLFFFFIP